MRIAFALQPRDRLGPGGMSGVTLATWQYARGLAARGHDVSLHARRGKGEAPEELREGVRVVRLEGDPRWQESAREILGGVTARAGVPRFLAAGYYRRFLAALLARLRETKPAVVHLSTQAQYLPSIRQALPGALLVLHLHDELITHLPPSWVIDGLQAADLIVCVRDQIRDRLADRFPSLEDRARTLLHGVDVERFRPASATGAAGAGGLDSELLYVGRLSPEKGLHVMAEAFVRLRRRHPGIRLRVVGSPGLMPWQWVQGVSDDPHVAALETFYGRTRLGRIHREVLQRGRGYIRTVEGILGADREGVAFLPFHTHDRLPEVYRGSSVLLAASVCLELPLPVFEAMASGVVPVVSYETEGEGVVRPGATAVRVRRSDPGDLARAVDTLLVEPARRASLGRAARDAVVAEGTWDRKTRELEALYVSFLAGRASR